MEISDDGGGGCGIGGESPTYQLYIQSVNILAPDILTDTAAHPVGGIVPMVFHSDGLTADISPDFTVSLGNDFQTPVVTDLEGNRKDVSLGDHRPAVEEKIDGLDDVELRAIYLEL